MSAPFATGSSSSSYYPSSSTSAVPPSSAPVFPSSAFLGALPPAASSLPSTNASPSLTYSSSSSPSTLLDAPQTPPVLPLTSGGGGVFSPTTTTTAGAGFAFAPFVGEVGLAALGGGEGAIGLSLGLGELLEAREDDDGSGGKGAPALLNVGGVEGREGEGEGRRSKSRTPVELRPPVLPPLPPLAGSHPAPASVPARLTPLPASPSAGGGMGMYDVGTYVRRARSGSRSRSRGSSTVSGGSGSGAGVFPGLPPLSVQLPSTSGSPFLAQHPEQAGSGQTFFPPTSSFSSAPKIIAPTASLPPSALAPFSPQLPSPPSLPAPPRRRSSTSASLSAPKTLVVGLGDLAVGLGPGALPISIEGGAGAGTAAQGGQKARGKERSWVDRLREAEVRARLERGKL
ncbi:hypothetical protein JCM10207_007828 [Rhodosporidiobolus poonsookiae]